MQDIPDEHHVARYCGRQKQIIEDGKVLGVQPQFFTLRAEKKPPETYLSCDWMEFFSEDRDEQLDGVCKALTGKMDKIGKTAKIAIMSVSSIKSCGNKHSKKIKILQKKKTSSYSGIYGLPQDSSDLDLLAALADEEMIDLVSFV